MDSGIISAIAELINGVGFPVAVCVALFWNNRETTKQHHEVLKEFRTVIQENTETLKILSERVAK